MPLPGKCHTRTATSSVESSPSLRYEVRTTLGLELNMCTLIRISCTCSGGRKEEKNAQSLKPMADKLVGRCTAVSMNRLSDRLQWRMHLIGGQLSTGTSIAMATAKWLRMGTVGGLVAYCVIFAGTYIAHAATYADIAFVYDSWMPFYYGRTGE